MFIPYGTDAPVYHFPFATIGLIVVNVVVFGLELAAPEQVEPWMLALGAGVHPLQWVSTNFLHADPVHLIGNMLFLWPFGLIVEGKIGWWRFLLLYLAIGVIQAAAIQLIFLGGDEGHALGASSCIFGLIATALIWAPKNDLSIWYFFSVGFMWRTGTAEVPVMVFAGAYFCWELFAGWLEGFDVSTPVLHLAGFFAGLPLAVGMISLRLVDCEGWDVFNVWRGNVGAFRKKKEPAAQPVDERKAAAKARNTLEKIESLMAQDQPKLALTLHRKAETTVPGWQLPEDQYRKLMIALEQKQAYAEMASLGVDYLRLHPDKQVKMRLKMAQVLVLKLKRPSQAMAVLSKIPPEPLPAELEKIRRSLIAQARRMQDDEEHVELAPEDW